MNQSLKSTSESVFLDANVLLEILLDRSKSELARAVLERHAGSLYISALTAHLVVHFGQAFIRLSVLRQFLADYTIIPLTEADFEWAFMNIRNSDFEDALQLGVAIRYGCYQFVTFDASLAKSYHGLQSIEVKGIG